MNLISHLNLKQNNWVEIKDGASGTYINNSQIKFQIAMLKSSLCNYSEAYILAKGIITVANTAATDVDANNTNKTEIFKNCALSTNCKAILNNTQLDNAKEIDIVIAVYNLLEYSNNYSKSSGSLFQYYRDEPALNNDGAIVGYADNHATDSFKF